MLDNVLNSLEVLLMVIIVIYCASSPSWWTNNNNRSAPCVKLKKDTRLMPGPVPLPVLGTAWVYSKLGWNYTFGKVHEFYEDMFAKYGDIFKEEALWNVPVYNVVAREDIEKVLRLSGKYPIRPPTEAIAQYRTGRPDRYASTGIVNEQGEKWHHLRTNLTSDLTSTKTIASFAPVLEQIADDWCEAIRAQRHPQTNQILNLERLASRLGLETICALVLGRRMGFLLPEESDQCTRLAHAVTNHFVACRDTYYGLPFWKLIPTPAYDKLTRSEEEIYDLVLSLIENADDCMAASPVFRSVMSANVDRREKTAAIVDFIAAGIYTMRNSLIFLFDLIARHNSAQDEIVDGKDDGNYIRGCINEAFRLLPTANCLARVTEAEVELSEYTLPSGSVVLCHTGLACRKEGNFRRAHEFIPERWNTENAKDNAAATFLVVPFGVGRRMCPGRRFIEQSLPVFLERTVKEFQMSVCGPLELQFEFLLAPKPPITMAFKDRC